MDDLENFDLDLEDFCQGHAKVGTFGGLSWKLFMISEFCFHSLFQDTILWGNMEKKLRFSHLG